MNIYIGTDGIIAGESFWFWSEISNLSVDSSRVSFKPATAPEIVIEGNIIYIEDDQ